MWSLYDKSEGKRSIYRPKQIFTIMIMSFGEKNLKILYIIIIIIYVALIPFLIFFKF